jgi:hypothetical protein
VDSRRSKKKHSKNIIFGQVRWGEPGAPVLIQLAFCKDTDSFGMKSVVADFPAASLVPFAVLEQVLPVTDSD